jgi:hypothetical protein
MASTKTSDLLDDYLVSYDENLAKYKKLPKRQIIELLELIMRRYAWLREHDAELPDAHIARTKLAKLLLVLYSVKKLPCTEADLRMMLDLHTPLLRYIFPEGPVEHVMEYIKENDLTPELCQSLHSFQAKLGKYGTSAASLQTIRQCLFTLLFMDEWDAIEPSKCWSEAIRRDFRAMKGNRKEHWRRLLKHIRGNVHRPLESAWATEASERLAAVGIDDFNKQLAVWFAPFRSGEPLPLSVGGSHVLKGLVLYVAVSGNETAKQTALWLLDVKWKQKRNVEKAVAALEVLGVSRQALMERNLIAKPTHDPEKALRNLAETIQLGRTLSAALQNPDDMISAARKMYEELENPQTPLMQKIAKDMKFWMTTGIEVDHHDKVMIVHGENHFYRLFLSDGKIERVTDNVELELDWERIPDSFRMRLDREDRSPKQLNLLAEYLRRDSVYGKYFRPRIKADKNTDQDED